MHAYINTAFRRKIRMSVDDDHFREVHKTTDDEVYVCMYVCIHICMVHKPPDDELYVCMYEYMYVRMYTYVYGALNNQ